MHLSIFTRDAHSVTSGSATRDDRDLVDFVTVGEQVANHGVSSFVVSGHDTFLLTKDVAFTLGSDQDFFNGVEKIFLHDLLLIATSSKNGGFVHDVHKVGTGQTNGTFSDTLEINFFGEGFVQGMGNENFLTGLEVWTIQNDATVKTTRAEQGWVKYVWAVGGGNYDNSKVWIETVHFNQDLVQRLFTFIMTSTHTGATLATDGVDFIDKDNAWSCLLSFLEQVTDTASTNTHKHFHKFRSGNVEKRYVGFAGYSAGDQGLTGSRGTHEQNTFRNLGTKINELFGSLQELDNF